LQSKVYFHNVLLGFLKKCSFSALGPSVFVFPRNNFSASGVYSQNSKKFRMIDELDNKILNIIQKNARIPNAEIARQVDMAPSAVLERIRKLEERGIIMGYEARLNAEALGLGLVAFIFVRTDDQVGGLATARQIAKIPEVQEVHDVAGEDCYLVKVRVRDTRHLMKVMREHLGKMKSIRSTRTTIVLETIKESGKLIIPESP
jgi:Lrp/AsnC family leucine-responsive transcriptional regulator